MSKMLRLRSGLESLRLIEVEVVEVENCSVVATAGVVDEAERVAGRPQLRVLGDPALYYLPDERVLQAGMQVDVQLVDEVDRVGKVLAADKQVQDDVEHFLLATAEQIVMDVGPAFLKPDIGGFPGQRRDQLAESQTGWETGAENTFESFVDGIGEAGPHGIRIERFTPNFVENVFGDLRHVGGETRILFDVSLRAIGIFGQIYGSACFAAELGHGTQRAAPIERRSSVPSCGGDHLLIVGSLNSDSTAKRAVNCHVRIRSLLEVFQVVVTQSLGRPREIFECVEDG